MADYKKMYLTLFNEVTDTISKLQEAQKKTEQIYIETDKPTARLIKRDEMIKADNRGLVL
jgi:hypothetical protein